MLRNSRQGAWVFPDLFKLTFEWAPCSLSLSRSALCVLFQLFPQLASHLTKLWCPACPALYLSTKPRWLVLFPYPFLPFFTLSLFLSFLFLLHSHRFNLLSAFLLSESHSSSATRLLDRFGRRRSYRLGSGRFELFNRRMSFVELVSLKGLRFWFWKVWRLRPCYCHLWLFPGKWIFELSLHRFKHFSCLHFADLWFESVLLAQMLGRQLRLTILVLLHTTGHASLCIAHFGLFMDALFTSLLLFSHFLIVN